FCFQAEEGIRDRNVTGVQTCALPISIKECTPDSFIIGEDNEEIKAGIIIWTGGVTGSPVLAESGFEITKGKVTVDGDMRAPGEDNIFILGDCAWVMDEEAGKPFP